MTSCALGGNAADDAGGWTARGVCTAGAPRRRAPHAHRRDSGRQSPRRSPHDGFGRCGDPAANLAAQLACGGGRSGDCRQPDAGRHVGVPAAGVGCGPGSRRRSPQSGSVGEPVDQSGLCSAGRAVVLGQIGRSGIRPGQGIARSTQFGRQGGISCRVPARAASVGTVRCSLGTAARLSTGCGKAS